MHGPAHVRQIRPRAAFSSYLPCGRRLSVVTDLLLILSGGAFSSPNLSLTVGETVVPPQSQSINGMKHSCCLLRVMRTDCGNSAKSYRPIKKSGPGPCSMSLYCSWEEQIYTQGSTSALPQGTLGTH